MPSLAAIVGASAGNTRRVELLRRIEAESSAIVTALEQRVLMFIPAGHRMRVSLNSGATGVGSYGCTISGYLVPAA